MRLAALAISGTIALFASGALAQPAPVGASAVRVAGVSDDLTCAAHYTLAAFAMHELDATAAEYYEVRASDAGKRYLALHPGETQQSYTARVSADAQTLQQQLVNNSLTPESLVSAIQSCEQATETRNVT